MYIVLNVWFTDRKVENGNIYERFNPFIINLWRGGIVCRFQSNHSEIQFTND